MAQNNNARADDRHFYRGKLAAGEIIAQVEYLVRRRFPDGRADVPKLKLQFARMGSVYCRAMQELETPSVGLLNIGGEPGKGSELAVAAHELYDAAELFEIEDTAVREAPKVKF